MDLTSSYVVTGGKKAGWTLQAGESGKMVDFASVFEPRVDVLAYAATYVKSPAARKAVISVGSDDGVKVWLNRKLVLARDVFRGAAPDQDQAPVELKAGWNEIMLKVTQGEGGWGFFFELQTPDGKPMTDVTFAPTKAE